MYTDDMPNMPDSTEIDMDDDGVIDFIIEYKRADIDPFDEDGGNLALIGVIDPIGLNQVLLKRENGNLFLRDTEIIEESVSDPLSWSVQGFSKQLISIYNNSDGNWPNKWEVSSTNSYSTYFLGIKMLNNNLTILGWIEIDVNTESGEIRVIDKGIL